MNSFERIHDRWITRFREGLPELIAHLDWSREQIEAEQTQRLRALLAYAKAHSPYQAERLKDIDSADFTLKDLPSIPPITKAEIMEHWDDLVTDPALTKAKANAHLAALRDDHETNPYFADKYYLSATGGSSGHRGLFIWDEDLFMATAGIQYRFEAQLDAQRPPDRPRRTAVICSGSYLHASRMVFPVSPDPQREVSVFPASTPIGDIVRGLNEFQPDRLVGYSSLVEELCAEALEGHLKIDLSRISVNSEPLTDEARHQARKAWGIDIHNSWGCVEIGLAAIESDAIEGMVLSEDCNIFEAADADGKLIEDGPANHLIVTGLYGKALPMIRYVLTDSPVITGTTGRNAPAYRRITEIRGRADVWFAYPGNVKIHPLVFRDVLGQHAAIIEYQVRQTPGGAEVDLVSHQKMDTQLIEKALRNNLAEAGLSGAQIGVRIVETLPRHPETNKLARFVALKA